ncbi:hypothetical protein INR77_01255 [Erythrobacter sp. SCSIO 43205]|uniref:hypothetical protein n=1 Tax=Erythrobacter sp. SCSIO 43205 TaxID=2779361 RepID=UPI001CA80642|nr:hypothetical protein [Erythrobacter sp. SCSIO 43205]UAB78403.1 hypothetical protein INR77_01255 [Erythrobacter sp. SCSIO 43205]
MSIPTKEQNRGAAIAPASRNQLGRWLHNRLTAQEQQEQTLIAQFQLSGPWARELARHCFGEAAND